MAEFKRLERYRVGGTKDKMELSIPLPCTPSGKVYQYSPNPDAAPRLFLLGQAHSERTIATEHKTRIQRQPGPGERICPYSGYTAPENEFLHFDDIAAIKKLISHDATEYARDYLREVAKNLNRSGNRGALFSINMEIERSKNPVLAPPIREDLLREMSCGICQRPYGVYALALFCPDCGAPNAAQHFEREGQLVSEQISVADAKASEGRIELAYRLMGNAHEDVVTAFETTLKTIFRHLVRRDCTEEFENLCAEKKIKNAFQNIEKTRENFRHLDLDPFGALGPDDLDFLQVNIQKRHVIGHNLGIVDKSYFELTKANQPGETVSLLGGEIERFVSICLNIIRRIEDRLVAPVRPQQ